MFSAIVSPGNGRATGAAPQPLTIARAAEAVVTTALVLLGAAVLAIWATDNLEILEVEGGALPLHFNSAIGLVLWGLAQAALSNGWRSAARGIAITLCLLGSALLVVNTGVGNGRLDGWLFTPPTWCLGYPPAGATLWLCLAFLVGGAALVNLTAVSAAPLRARFAAIIGAALAAGSLALLFRPIVVAAGFAAASQLELLAIGAAGLALVVRSSRRGAFAGVLQSKLPIAILVVGFGGTVALWIVLDDDQERRIRHVAQFEAAHLHRAIEETLKGEINTLATTADRWTRLNAEEEKHEIDLYVGRRPGCLGVARVASDLKVSWAECREQLAPELDLASLGVSGSFLNDLTADQVLITRPPRSAWGGRRMLVLVTKGRNEASATAAIAAVFRLEGLLDSVANVNIAGGYGVEIADGPEVLLSRHINSRDESAKWTQRLQLRTGGTDWRLEVWPTGEVLEKEHTLLPRLALLIGFVTTILLSITVRLAQTARARSRELELQVLERTRAQRALSQSEQKYRTLIENLGQGVFLQDQYGRYAAANPQFCRSLGRAEAEIIGRTDAELFDAGRALKYAREAREVLIGGTSVESEEDFIADGQRTVTRRVLTPVRDATGQPLGVLGICWDVTHQRMLESHVQQASKMDAIGQLAGGIAHDFNNLLTVILGNIEVMLAVLPADDQARVLAEEAKNAATRAGGLTRRLLGFARRHQLDWQPIDLNKIVDEVVALLRRTIDPLVEIDICPARTVWPVRGDASQINQVLMNLCLNARDAIVGRGSIRIETGTLEGSELPQGHLLHAATGGFVRLSVIDTGSGMAEDVKARMYEPFFTTKDVGKGTGLGLPMVFAAVRNHKGWIDCHSEVGRGTRFDIYFPRAETAPTVDDSADLSPPVLTTRATVLVVDDEEMIRRLAVTILSSIGYETLEAANGQQAIDIYRREKGRIDLVVLDLTMPVMSGREAFRQLLQIDRDVRVLFASGYSADQLTDFEAQQAVGFVSKPYRPNEFASVVAKAIGREVASRHDDPDAAKPALCGICVDEAVNLDEATAILA